MIIKGCKNCRRRHIKCSVKDGTSSCDKCSELRRPCEWDPPFRFKEVDHVYQNEGSSRSRFSFIWDRQQVWMNPPILVDFVIEGSVTSVGEWEPTVADEGTPSGAFLGEQPNSTREDFRFYNATALDNVASPGVQGRSENPLGPTNSQYSEYSYASYPDHGLEAAESPASHRLRSSLSSPLVPSLPSSLEYSESYTSTSGANQEPAFSPHLTTKRTLLEPREACLLRYYVDRVSPWLDVCDSRSHFATEVPRRALGQPMVMFAVLTMASRLESILSGSTDMEATAYHDRCLELLIPALSRSEDTYDDNLLVTVIILRLYEELDSHKDPKLHLLGSNRLLNSISQFTSSGGVGEAASWQFLRQAIYVCLVQKEPWQLRLDHYEQSKVFQRSDDASYANVMIFIFAKILHLTSQPSNYSNNPHEWESLRQSIERWNAEKPCSFIPLKYHGPNVDDNRPFSEIWMISPAAVVGMQYYYAAVILLYTHRPLSPPTFAFEEAKQHRAAEHVTISHLADIVGLAKSHENVENANFTACHLLYCYGYCLFHPVQRREASVFLRHMENTMGWKTSWIIEALERQWGELDTLNSRGCDGMSALTGLLQ